MEEEDRFRKGKTWRKVSLSPLPQPLYNNKTTCFPQALLYSLPSGLHVAKMPFSCLIAPALLRSLCTAQRGHLSLWQSLSDSVMPATSSGLFLTASQPWLPCWVFLHAVARDNASCVKAPSGLSVSLTTPTSSFFQYRSKLITANPKATSKLPHSCPPRPPLPAWFSPLLFL